MANLKSLAKDTAIYGLSSIVGRFLNYLLVPVYTMAMSAQSGGYGVVTNIYAWVALMLVLLTFGMETGFFRFANNGKDDPMRVYSTSLLGVGGVSLAFLALGLVFLQPIAGLLGYEEHPWYVGMMMIVVAMDAIQSIPFAYLRYRQRPLKFAALKLLFIFLNIALNLIYYVWMEGSDVGYAFLFNLICTSTVMVCMIPELSGFRYVLDRALLRRMLSYCMPLLVLGIAGILNQVADKIIFPYVYPDKAEATVQLGIYGAASKIAMIMAMLTQAFRYAYEPFVFGKSRDKDNREVYAQAMKFFIIFTLLAYLAVMFYMDLLKHIIGRGYWEGLRVVPIVMAADSPLRLHGLCLGRLLGLRGGHAAVLLRGAEEVPHPLRPEGHRLLRAAGGGALCGGRIRAAGQRVAPSGLPHRAAAAVCGLHCEEGPAPEPHSGTEQAGGQEEMTRPDGHD